MGVLTLIGKADDAKDTANKASIANAITATKIVLAEGVPQAGQVAAIETELSGSDVAVSQAATTPFLITLSGKPGADLATSGLEATVSQAGAVTNPAP